MDTTRFRQALLPQMVRLIVFVSILSFTPMSLALAESVSAFSTAQMHAINTPISIRTTLQFDQSWGEQSGTLWLAGLGSQQQAPPETLALQWTQGTWSWFPSWRLQLTSAIGLKLQPVNGKQLSLNEDDYPILSTARPTPGHSYTSLLSYDTDLGIVSVAVTDATDKKIIYTGAFYAKASSTTVPNPAQSVKNPSSLYPSAGVSGDVGLFIPRYGAIETSDKFIPAWQQWEVGALSDQTHMYESAYLVERNSSMAVRLNSIQVARPTGEYRVLLGNGTATHTVALDTAQSNNWSPISFGILPLGNVELTLEYVVDGRVWLSETRELSVGSIALQVNPIELHHEHKSLQGSVLISSTSDLSGLELSVLAKMRRIVWDSDRRAYQEVDAGELPLFKHNFVTTGSEMLVPFTAPLPPEPGFWKLVIDTVTNIPIRTKLTGSEQLLATYTPAQLEPVQDYTFAVFPDTQGYTVGNQDIFTRQVQWVAENAAERNITLMLHMGDITQDNVPQQWEKAQNSLRLLDAVVPYVLTIGNHDMAPSGGVRARGETLINNYFPASKFPALAGTFAPDRVEDSYHTFNFGGVDYMVIALEFGPPDEVLNWANEVVASHPNHRVIVITHTFVNKNGTKGGDPKRYGLAKNPQTTVNDGNDMWSKFLSKHANIFMVMSGHIGVPTIPYNISIGEKGNHVYSFLMDYQGEPQGGNGWMPLFTFHPNNTVEINAYSPYLNQNKTQVDSNGFNNHFMIDLATGTVSLL